MQDIHKYLSNARLDPLVDRLAVREPPDHPELAEQLFEAWRDLRKPVFCTCSARLAKVGFPVPVVVAFGEPDRREAAIGRNTKICVGIAKENTIFAAAPALKRFERRESGLGRCGNVVDEALIGPVGIIVVLIVEQTEGDSRTGRLADGTSHCVPPSSCFGEGSLAFVVRDVASSKLKKQAGGLLCLGRSGEDRALVRFKDLEPGCDVAGVMVEVGDRKAQFSTEDGRAQFGDQFFGSIGVAAEAVL